MNPHKAWWIDTNFETVKKNLEARNFECFVIEKKEDVVPLLEKLISKGSVVSCGGSMTLFECGVIDFLRNGNYNFLDRYKEGITPEELGEIYRKSFWADYYLMSTNAITLDGKLINIDGNGNRLAALLFGPKNVIVIAGKKQACFKRRARFAEGKEHSISYELKKTFSKHTMYSGWKMP